MAHRQEGEVPQGMRDFWQRFFGGQPEPVPAHARIFVPDRPHDILIQGTEAIRLTHAFIEEVAEFDTQAAVDFLDTKFYGQAMTDRYRAMCATALGQELDRQNVRNHTRRARLLPRAIEAHITKRLREEPRWNRQQIEQVNAFNQGVTGEIMTRNPYFYWQWDRTTIANTLNTERPWDDERSFKLSHLIAPIAIVGATAIGVVAVGLAARAAWKWCTSAQSMPVMSSFIIPSMGIPQQPLTSNATELSTQTITTQIASAVSTGISKGLGAIHDSIQEQNTLVRSTTQLVDELMNRQPVTLTEALRSWIASRLLPK